MLLRKSGLLLLFGAVSNSSLQLVEAFVHRCSSFSFPSPSSLHLSHGSSYSSPKSLSNQQKQNLVRLDMSADFMDAEYVFDPNRQNVKDYVFDVDDKPKNDGFANPYINVVPAKPKTTRRPPPPRESTRSSTASSSVPTRPSSSYVTSFDDVDTIGPPISAQTFHPPPPEPAPVMERHGDFFGRGSKLPQSTNWRDPASRRSSPVYETTTTTTAYETPSVAPWSGSTDKPGDFFGVNSKLPQSTNWKEPSHTSESVYANEQVQQVSFSTSTGLSRGNKLMLGGFTKSELVEMEQHLKECQQGSKSWKDLYTGLQSREQQALQFSLMRLSAIAVLTWGFLASLDTAVTVASSWTQAMAARGGGTLVPWRSSRVQRAIFWNVFNSSRLVLSPLLFAVQGAGTIWLLPHYQRWVSGLERYMIPGPIKRRFPVLYRLAALGLAAASNLVAGVAVAVAGVALGGRMVGVPWPRRF